jgi:hypothetical protein
MRLFASAYRIYGVETIRHAIVEVSGKAKPFANRNGYTLRVEAVRRARAFALNRGFFEILFLVILPWLWDGFSCEIRDCAR